jgi:hypothetical protein
MARAPVRPPRLLPLPATIGAEPDAFAAMSPEGQEMLGSLVYLSAGVSTGVGDGNYRTSTFIANLDDSVYSQYMNQAGTVTPV